MVETRGIWAKTSKVLQYNFMPHILPISQKGRTTVEWKWWRPRNAKVNPRDRGLQIILHRAPKLPRPLIVPSFYPREFPIIFPRIRWFAKHGLKEHSLSYWTVRQCTSQLLWTPETLILCITSNDALHKNSHRRLFNFVHYIHYM